MGRSEPGGGKEEGGRGGGTGERSGVRIAPFGRTRRTLPASASSCATRALAAARAGWGGVEGGEGGDRSTVTPLAGGPVENREGCQRGGGSAAGLRLGLHGGGPTRGRARATTAARDAGGACGSWAAASRARGAVRGKSLSRCSLHGTGAAIRVTADAAIRVRHWCGYPSRRCRHPGGCTATGRAASMDA